jgi:hypothetical protein
VIQEQSGPTAIRIFIPDAGPLISLAVAGELDLLLAVSEDVRIAVTDVVHWEVTHRGTEKTDAVAIAEFIEKNLHRIDVVATTVGQLALGDLKRRMDAGEPPRLSKDLGELSISNAIISMRMANPGEPTLVLVEDDWFSAHLRTEGNVHLLSTSSWLEGLQVLGVIASAADVRARILRGRPHFRADYLEDSPAGKIDGGTEWRSTFGKKGRY